MAKLNGFKEEGKLVIVEGYLKDQYNPRFDVNFKPGVKLSDLTRSELEAMVKAWSEDAYDVMHSDLTDRLLKSWGEEPMPGFGA